MLRFRSRKEAEEAGVLRERAQTGDVAPHPRRINEIDSVGQSGSGPKAESGPSDPASSGLARRRARNRRKGEQQRDPVGEPVGDAGGALELDFAPAGVQSVDSRLGLGFSPGQGPGRALLVNVPLPMSPSTNAYWGDRVVWSSERKRHFAIRYVTHEGKAYQKLIRELMLERRAWFRSEHPLSLKILLCFADKRENDCDNRIKPLQDALQYGHVYANDVQIKQLEVREGPLLKPAVAFVTLREILPDRQANLAWISAL